MLRGSRELAETCEYEASVVKLFDQLNTGRKEKLAHEMEVPRPLPARHFNSAKRVRVRVNIGTLITVERNTCSVNSRSSGNSSKPAFCGENRNLVGRPRSSNSCPACEDRRTTGSITATLSTSWREKRARSPAIDIASTCSRRASSERCLDR